MWVNGGFWVTNVFIFLRNPMYTRNKSSQIKNWGFLKCELAVLAGNKICQN